MAKKPALGPPVKAPWKGFINWSPSVEEKMAIRSYADKGMDLDKLLECFLDHGYRVSFDVEARNSCSKMAITGEASKTPNDGYTLTVRHVNLDMLFAQAWYYCEHLHDWGAWVLPTEGTSAHDW